MAFLPITLLLYFLIPERFLKVRNLWLLIASLIFYAWGEPKYIAVMAFSILFNYVMGRIVAKSRPLLILCIAGNLAILGFFKYTDFVIETVNAVSGGGLGLLNIALPIGISFYTFQTMSYIIDVYRGKVLPQRDFIAFAAYVTLFPQLIAGPIVRYSDVAEMLVGRKTNLDQIAEGVRRFIVGFGKKVLLANQVYVIWNEITLMPVSEISTAAAWLGALAFTFQIYFDFSGYSDMAIGLGKIFGFDNLENFNYPYISRSITEFWRRWHMSLSSWFKEYVYIPLGGNRRGTARTYVNLWTVFLLTGIWHGAGWTFIFWGIYHGFFNVLERCFLGKWLKQEKFRPLAHIYAVFVVLIGWIFFRADTIGQAFSFIRYMFVPHSAVVLMERYMNRKLWIFLAAALLACGPVQWFWMKWKGRVLAQDGSVTVTSWIGYMAILWFSILLLVNNTYNPFIYFRF